MSTLHVVRWSVTPGSETYNRYRSEAAAERRAQDLRILWGRKLSLLEINPSEDEEAKRSS